MGKWVVFLMVAVTGWSYADGGISSRLNIKTEDGTVSNYPYQLRITNGDLTDHSDGTMSLSITGGGGGGTSALGISSGSATNSVVVSSPTSNVVFSSNTFIVNLQGTTTSFVTANPSSVTLQGVITAGTLGALTSNQSITWTGSGDVSGTASGATSITPTLTASALQNNITTFGASSITITGISGSSTTYRVYAGSYTGAGLGTCGSSSQAESYTSTNTFACTTITAAGIGALTGNQTITLSGDSSGSGATAITVTNAALQNNITTFGSSITVTNVKGSSTTFGLYGGSVTVNDLTASQFVTTDANKKLTSSLNGATLTSLAGANIATNIPSSVLPSTIDYIVSSQTVTAFKSWTSSVAFSGGVSISSTIILSGSPGANGNVMTSGGNGAVPTWGTAGAGTITGIVGGTGLSGGDTSGSVTLSVVSTAAFITSTQTWTAAQTYVNAVTLTLSSATFNSGIVVSSGIIINTTPVITSTTTLTSTMSVVLASCTVAGTGLSFMTLTLPSATSFPGLDMMIYKLDPSTCEIRIQTASNSEVIEGTRTIRLDAKTQHASLHSLGSGLWGSGLGGIQWTPYMITTIPMDNAAFTVATASVAYQCPVYVPVPINVTGFRVDKAASSGFLSFGIFDLNGNYVVGVSTIATVAGASNYALTSAFNLSPGWYKVAVMASNTLITLSGSNSVNDHVCLCSQGSNSNGNIDMSKITLTTGINSGVLDPFVGVVINGGQTAN